MGECPSTARVPGLDPACVSAYSDGLVPTLCYEQQLHAEPATSNCAGKE